VARRPATVLVTILVLSVLAVTPGRMSPGAGAAIGQAAALQAADEWSRRADLPQTNSEIAAAGLDGKIYVVGGYPMSRVVTNAVQVYDAAADTWSLGPPLPLPLHHTIAAAVDGVLYVVGGEFEPSGVARQGVFQDRVWAYDPRREVDAADPAAAWMPRATMPTARSGMASDVIDGKLYVVGGRPPRGSDFAVYDPAADEWTVLPELPTQRNHLAAAAIDGKLYVAGGRFGGGVGSEMTAALEVYDPATNTWTVKAPLLAPRAGVNGAAVAGCLYVFGGEGNDAHPLGVFGDVDVYDPRADAWLALAPLPVAVHGVTGAPVLSEWVHLAGGGTSRGGSSGSTLHQVFRPAGSCR
jgi:N-acetylneuraminic acid mutarotase